MKQETLEEAAERYYEDEVSINAFINGAKWQQERSYSEEDLKEAFKYAYTLGFRDYLQEIFKQEKCDEWFELFKNK